ncbi:hypothetical protein YC2023_120287 [Brassica napus]
MNVDTSGITALVELHNNLIQIGIEFYGRLKLVIPGPQGRRQVNMFCLLLQKLNITFRQGSARL